jgi:hypothetical protein
MDRRDLALILAGSVDDWTLPTAGTSAVADPGGTTDKAMLLSPLGLPVAGCLSHGGVAIAPSAV